MRQGCVNVATMVKWVSDLNGPKGNRLALSPAQIDELPTIDIVIDFFRKLESDFAYGGGWKRRLPDFSLLDKRKIRNPRRGFFNDASDDSFVLNRLCSGRFNLQPNLRNKTFLYRGQNEFFPSLQSGFNLLPLEDCLIENLRYNEFYLMLKTHPLCRMFDNGIHLEGFSEPIFFETNYYGFAQHYGFKTGLIDFSCDIMVSAFFAVTKAVGNDEYIVFNDPGVPYGVIYSWDLIPDECFSIDGFSTVGKQYFPRCGSQRGFFLSRCRNHDGLKRLVAIPFKHSHKEDKAVYDYWEGGAKLFPDDEITSLSKEILSSNVISLQAFAYNKYINPRDEYKRNLQICESKGIEINPDRRFVLNSQRLQPFFLNAITYWERFCEDIYFGEREYQKQALDALKNLPFSPHYRHFFTMEFFEQLYYAQNYEEFKNQNPLAVD